MGHARRRRVLGGFLLALSIRFFWGRLHGLFVLVAISVFLALAVEPGVNRLARRGLAAGHGDGADPVRGARPVRRCSSSRSARSSASQIADLLSNSEKYVTDTVNFDQRQVRHATRRQRDHRRFNDPNGAVQKFIKDQQDKVVNLSVTALGVLLQLFSVLLFTFYLVADGPKLRRAICSRLRPDPPGAGAARRGSWPATRPAGTSTRGPCWPCSRPSSTGSCSSRSAPQAPVALALWVGIVSQFLPVVGTYLAGVLPVLLTFLDSPIKALIVLIFVVLYQQVENYFFCRASPPARWSCTRRWRSAPRSAGQPCSARSAPCWPCRRRRWPRR